MPLAMGRSTVDDACIGGESHHHHIPAMTTINLHSHSDIASSLNLWREYIDPEMAISDDEFAGMAMDQRLSLIVETFGPEPTNDEISEDLGFLA